MEGSEIDFDALWKEYSRDACFIGDPEASKRLWIIQEKRSRGIPVDPIDYCYECKGPVYTSMISYHADAKKHVPICEKCMPAFEKDPRHSLAWIRK